MSEEEFSATLFLKLPSLKDAEKISKFLKPYHFRLRRGVHNQGHYMIAEKRRERLLSYMRLGERYTVGRFYRLYCRGMKYKTLQRDITALALDGHIKTELRRMPRGGLSTVFWRVS